MVDSLLEVFENALQITRSSELLSNALESLKNLQRKPLKGLPEITLKEVACHDAINDCWVIIYDRVYDVTNFLFSVRINFLLIKFIKIFLI